MTIHRDVDTRHGDTHLRGLLVSPSAPVPHPGVVLIHDAFGLAAEMVEIAEHLADEGFAVFAADLWGERFTPAEMHEIGPRIGGMVSDRSTWISRVAQVHESAAAQPEIDADRIAMLGYCFGGSSALEYQRVGGLIRGVIAIHPGLDLIEFDWSQAAPGSSTLVIMGAQDPMATPEQWQGLKAGMQGADIDWELNLYANTVHGFTSPKTAHSPNKAVADFHPRNAARAWNATLRTLHELFPSA